MEKAFCALLMLLSIKTYAQSVEPGLKDDLLIDKQIILAKYLPMNKGAYLYQLYAMKPAVFIEKIKAYKVALGAQYAAEKNEAIRLLKIKDADFNSRNVATRYIESYGIDSLAIVRLHQLMEEKKDDAQIDSAYNMAFVKKLSDKERLKLDRFVEENADLNDEALFKRSMAYRHWLDGYITKLSIIKCKQDNVEGYDDAVKIKVINNEISNPFIREYLIYRATGAIIKMAKDRAVSVSAFHDFMAIVTNPAYKAEIEEMYANDRMMSEQGEAPDFTYKSIDGTSVSLKDLRGKYVYIDVWATWCAPCKAEIPFLTRLEEDCHSKNIHFVSIAIDKMINRTKWVNYVNEHQLKGIQLIADKDFSSDFVKKFNINSIPRFILIDPAGKIVSGDAKRPSDPELRRELDTLLK